MATSITIPAFIVLVIILAIHTVLEHLSNYWYRNPGIIDHQETALWVSAYILRWMLTLVLIDSLLFTV